VALTERIRMGSNLGISVGEVSSNSPIVIADAASVVTHAIQALNGGIAILQVVGLARRYQRLGAGVSTVSQYALVQLGASRRTLRRHLSVARSSGVFLFMEPAGAESQFCVWEHAAKGAA
jgi:hypothetical protein